MLHCQKELLSPYIQRNGFSEKKNHTKSKCIKQFWKHMLLTLLLRNKVAHLRIQPQSPVTCGQPRKSRISCATFIQSVFLRTNLRAQGSGHGLDLREGFWEHLESCPISLCTYLCRHHLSLSSASWTAGKAWLSRDISCPWQWWACLCLYSGWRGPDVSSQEASRGHV